MDFHQQCAFYKNMYFWYLTKYELLVHISLNAAIHRREEHQTPLFNSQRNKQQTALPLPATGEQTGPKACQRQDNPVRLIDGETP
ncbi:hypothetical protein [Pseudomonas sp. OV226]|uniref:hypothetical protein n=1 Tax=Pseudomonas sp. OV226 TaxID=2135588 RepID=UPI0011B24502|nr:hypothetical protein [Pseudomonas sp. OV226]